MDTNSTNVVKKRWAILATMIAIILTIATFAPVFGISAQADNSKNTSDELIASAKNVIDWEKERYGIEKSGKLFSGDFLENAGSAQSDWFAIGLSRFGFDDDYQAYLGALGEAAKRLSYSDKATDWHRTAIAVCAVGGDPTDCGGVDLVEKGVYGRTEENSVGKQGANGWIFALLTLDTMGFFTPEGAVFDRERLIKEICSCQNADGGFSLSGKSSDVDITAMAVQALAVYQDDFTRSDITAAVDNALSYLSEKQGADGSFGSCEADAQAIIALCAAGVDIENDERFTKNGTNILQALLSYQNSDGGFAHLANGDSDEYASGQALCALAAAERQRLTMRRIYDFREELSVLQREKLDGTNGRLSALADADEDTAYAAVKLFNDLDCDERTYIKYGRELKAAAEKFGIALSDRDFTAELCQSEQTTGCIFSIEKTEIYKGESGFSDDDLAQYEKLKKSGAGSADCTLAAVLLSKAKADESLSDRENIIADLEKLSQQAEELYSEVCDLNKLISERLYPVETVGNDKANMELLKSTAERIKALPKAEQQKVTAEEDILKAAENGSETVIIVMIGVIICAGIVTIVAVKKFKSKGKKSQILEN